MAQLVEQAAAKVTLSERYDTQTSFYPLPYLRDFIDGFLQEHTRFLECLHAPLQSLFLSTWSPFL